MPEHCPICKTELLGGEYCPTCKRRVVDEQLALTVEMLTEVIAGWEKGKARLQSFVDRLRKTKDGVPVVPGDTVFGFVIHGFPNSGGQKSYGLQPLVVSTPVEHGDYGPEDWVATYSIPRSGGCDAGEMRIEDCYSARPIAEDAEAALA